MNSLLKLALVPLIMFAPACREAGGPQPGQADAATAGFTHPVVFPRLTGRVVDEANILPPKQELDLTAKSAALESANGRQLVIVTVPSLQGQDIATFTRNLGRHWGIGRKDENDGVILLVAPNEKQVRIAAGYGFEKTLTNRASAQILQEQVLPRFRKGDMAGGVAAGTDALISQLR